LVGRQLEKLERIMASESETSPLPENSEQSRPRRGVWRSLREVLETIVPAILIAVLINVFLGQATRVDGQSMEPSLYTDQRVVVEKVSYRFHGPERFDVVVIKLPDQGDELLIKRVIGLPGELLEIRNGLVYIDDKLLEEPLVTQQTRTGRYGKTTIPPLHVFVMGDNRGHSNDSRSFGPVPIANILGRAWLSYWPLEEAGKVR
jgi:signal peptidase I